MKDDSGENGKGGKKSGSWASFKEHSLVPAIVGAVVGTLIATLIFSVVIGWATLRTDIEINRVAIEDNSQRMQDGFALINARLDRIEDRLGRLEERLTRVEAQLDVVIEIQTQQGIDVENLKEQVASSEANP